jgi:hypothetical protein
MECLIRKAHWVCFKCNSNCVSYATTEPGNNHSRGAAESFIYLMREKLWKRPSVERARRLAPRVVGQCRSLVPALSLASTRSADTFCVQNASKKTSRKVKMPHQASVRCALHSGTHTRRTIDQNTGPKKTCTFGHRDVRQKWTR